MGQNLVEKIVNRFSVGLDEGQKVFAGDFVSIQPAHVMTHDNTGAVIPKFKKIGATRISNPRQPVYALDHNVQDTSVENLAKYKKIQDFASEMGIDFYPAGRGIGHQIMCEEGYAWPGTLVVASDSHSNMYGGLGCLGTPVVRTDAAALWATGRTWWQIPPVVKVILTGKLHEGVTGKDVIIALCGYFNKDEVLNHVLEFHGDGIKGLSVSDRLAIANMTTEWGALAGIFPIDEVTIEWLRKRADFIEKRGLAAVPSDSDGKGMHPRMNHKRIDELEKNPLKADSDAFYVKDLTLDLSTVQPCVSGPNTVKTMTTVTKIRKDKIKIHKAYLLSCVNSRENDIEIAAQIIKGKKVAEHVELYIAPASSEVQKESEKRGNWKTLLDAGAIALPPGCGPCIGLGKGLLKDNEIGISATNRNFKGRMGSKNAGAYLASPAIVAASAVSGYIDMPDDMARRFEKLRLELKGNVKVNKRTSTETAELKIIDGFPVEIKGELLFCYQDNLNTDGIYPGKYTYIDDFSPEQQAAVAMENYDPQFQKIARDGDILIGGFNFGTGSSREQAATALKYQGIKLVIAGSFSQTYQRNALNNGFLVLAVPELVQDMKDKFGKEKLTVRSGIEAVIDYKKSVIKTRDKSYEIAPVGIAAQELIVEGGLENWIKKRL